MFQDHGRSKTSSAGWENLEIPSNEIFFPAQLQSSCHSIRLAVFESRRENDCVTKFLLDEYEDSTAHQYAIGAARLQFSQKLISVNSGIKVDDTYTGVYEWDRVETSTDNQDAATLAFSNWVPGNKSLIFHINVDY